MARPELDHTSLVAFIHATSVGTRVSGFTLDSRTEHDGGHWYEVVVTKGPRTWTVSYLWHDPVGRIVRIVDEDGRQWSPLPDKSDWADDGIR